MRRTRRLPATPVQRLMSEEGWKRFGLIKGPGLPAPIGQYTVGCVDLMHKLEGDNDGLLVRLFYPTTPQIHRAVGAAGSGYQYAKWMPDKRYVKASLVRTGSRFPGFLSTVSSFILDPRVPAFEGAPLYQHDSSKQGTGITTSDKASSHPDLSTERKEGETAGENSTSKEEWQRQPDQSAEEEQTTTAPPSATSEAFPVVVFSHGLAAMRTICSGICSDLASQGFVVAAVEHRDGSAAVVLKRIPKPGGPEGQLVDEWMEYQYPESERNAEFDPQNYQDVHLRHQQVKKRSFDVRQALNLLHLLNDGGNVQNMLDHSRDYDFSQFKGRLDVEAAAVMGHSFGGGTTVLALHDESRFRCGITLDGWMVPFPEDFLQELSVTQPLLFINSYTWQWKRNIQSMMKLIRTSEERGNSCCSIITLKDTDHYNQTDVKFAMPAFIQKELRKALATIDPFIAHQINQQVCHAFLKRHQLKDPVCQQNIPDLDGGEGCSEYIVHGTNVDLSDSTDGSICTAGGSTQGESQPLSEPGTTESSVDR